MDLDINIRCLPLPKEAHFLISTNLLLKTEKSKAILKIEILQKIKSRVILALPLLKSDFESGREISIHNGEITSEDLNKIDKFLEDIEKVNIEKYGMNVIESAFKKEIVINECKESSKVVEIAVKDWFKKYLNLLDESVSLAVETAMKQKHKVKCKIPKALYK